MKAKKVFLLRVFEDDYVQSQTVHPSLDAAKNKADELLYFDFNAREDFELNWHNDGFAYTAEDYKFHHFEISEAYYYE